MTEVIVTRLVMDSDALRASTDVLSDDERKRASRFAFDRDRRRFILTRARLRRLLAERLRIPAQSVAIVYGKHGKPAIEGSRLRFNVSHCDDVAVFAFSVDAEVGVDVEAIRFLSDAAEIVTRLFSPRESEEYQSLGLHERSVGFFNCWTRKEAFVKALGTGMSHPLDSFDVTLAPAQPAKILRVENMPGEKCGWTIESFSPAAGYIGALVTQNAS